MRRLPGRRRRTDGDGNADARARRPTGAPGATDPRLVPRGDPELRGRRLRDRRGLNRGSDERGALEAVERILNRGGDADVVLRAVLEALQSRGASSARVLFMED